MAIRTEVFRLVDGEHITERSEMEGGDMPSAVIATYEAIWDDSDVCAFSISSFREDGLRQDIYTKTRQSALIHSA